MYSSCVSCGEPVTDSSSMICKECLKKACQEVPVHYTVNGETRVCGTALLLPDGKVLETTITDLELLALIKKPHKQSFSMRVELEDKDGGK